MWVTLRSLNCGFAGTVTGVNDENGTIVCGGIMGRVWDYAPEGVSIGNGILNNCYSVGSEITGANIGQFWRSSGTLTNLYSDVNTNTAWAVPNKLTADQMKGSDAIANMAFDRLSDITIFLFPLSERRAMLRVTAQRTILILLKTKPS